MRLDWCAPSYIERGGTQDIANPFALEHVLFDAFLFRADYAALARLLDRDLNRVFRREAWRRPFGLVRPSYRVVPLAPVVLLVSAQSQRIQIQDRGWMPEIDVAFWIPALLLRKVGPLLLPVRATFYQPYLFVDSGQAMATGRESYGYHKMIGSFELPSDPSHVEKISVDSIAFASFGPNVEGVEQRIFTLSEVSGSPSSDSAFAGFEQAVEAFLAEVADDGTELTVRALNRAIDLLEVFDLLRVSQVFLKQLRSIRKPDRASFQRVTEVQTPITHFHRGGYLRGEYELNIHDLASHPIRRELGLADGPLRSLAQMWLDFDFDLPAGRELGAAI